MRVENAPFGTGEIAWGFPFEVAEAFVIAAAAAGVGAATGAGAPPTGAIFGGMAIGLLTSKGLTAGRKVVADWVKKDPERAGKAAEEAVKKEYNEF